jgi:hypothetical protein
VLLAARQAAAGASGKQVRVVPSTTVPQGISAMLEYQNAIATGERALDAIASAMSAALANAVTVEITNATRDAEFDGIQVRAGQYIGLINDTLVAAGDDIQSVTTKTLQLAKADTREIITLYYGSDATEESARAMVEHLAAQLPNQEFEIVHGGQALYPYIISVE